MVKRATSGRALGIVVGTGTQTEIGRVSTLTESIGREKTPLQHKRAVLGKQLGFAVVAIAIIVSVAGWAKGKPLLEMFLTGSVQELPLFAQSLSQCAHPGFSRSRFSHVLELA
ncbi:P-type ATPase [Novipirellula aureliae]|uniref:P-type ATPase n=1 Tax=Novipirellula aureliae TaxID=2527966 RepID=UPI0011B370DE|nr:hypothetical protein [Novipirellula aureliae]